MWGCVRDGVGMLEDRGMLGKKWVGTRWDTKFGSKMEWMVVKREPTFEEWVLVVECRVPASLSSTPGVVWVHSACELIKKHTLSRHLHASHAKLIYL